MTCYQLYNITIQPTRKYNKIDMNFIIRYENNITTIYESNTSISHNHTSQYHTQS